MSASELQRLYSERLGEIQHYLEFLKNLESAAKFGAPRFKETNESITTDQSKILYSSLYLQLYNLVEATVSNCLESVVKAISVGGLKPRDMGVELRRQWVRSVAKTHVVLNPENRLEAAIAMCDHLLGQLPVAEFRIEAGGGGNWDDSSIEKMCQTVGCRLTISRAVSAGAKKHVRDEMGALKLVKSRRNSLAHGSLSFVDCSDGVTVAELESLVSAVGDYLQEAVSSFISFIDNEVTGTTGAPSAFSVGATR